MVDYIEHNHTAAVKMPTLAELEIKQVPQLLLKYIGFSWPYT
jgi:hypothetical protein